VDRVQVEVEQGIEFVKQMPRDGIHFLLQILTAFHSSHYFFFDGRIFSLWSHSSSAKLLTLVSTPIELVL